MSKTRPADAGREQVDHRLFQYGRSGDCLAKVVSFLVEDMLTSKQRQLFQGPDWHSHVVTTGLSGYGAKPLLIGGNSLDPSQRAGLRETKRKAIFFSNKNRKKFY
jgi:hypothetical protein